jgi:hypothetical protein
VYSGGGSNNDIKRISSSIVAEILIVPRPVIC